MMKKIFIVIIMSICLLPALSGCANDAALPVTETPAGIDTGKEDLYSSPAEITNPLYFDPVALGFGKTFSDTADALSDLEYRGGLELGWPGFYSGETDIIYKFVFHELVDVDNPNPDAVVKGVKAPAKIIFPDLESRIRKAEIEEILGVELPDKKGQNLEYDGGIFEVFRTQGYVFLYWATEASLYPPDDFAEDIAPETHIDVAEEDAWDEFIRSGFAGG